MKKNLIPNTDLNVSEFCMGTMTFADPLEQNEVNGAVAYAFEHGVNFYDTADIYPPGKAGASEKLLGAALKPIRDQVILATKAGGPMSPDPKDRGLSRAHLMSAVDDSLKRLGTDYIDLFYLHFADKTVPYEELVRTMDDLVDSGKIRYYGVSNHPAWLVCEMCHLAPKHKPVVFQSVYNFISRSADDELLPFLNKYNIGLTTYNPLAGGMLTGKYLNGDDAGGRLVTNAGYRARYHNDIQIDATRELNELAKAAGMSLLEYSFQWLRAKEQINSILVGFSRQSQLEQNLAFFEKDDLPQFPEDEILAIWKKLDRKCHPYFHF